MECLGHIDIKADPLFFKPVSVTCTDNQSILAIRTEAGWLVMYDVQKEKVVHCLIGHNTKIRKFVRNKKPRANFYSLG